MKVYPKILFATIPFVLLTLLTVVGTTYYFSSLGLTNIAEEWLEARLSEAMQIVEDQKNLLKQYGLSDLPAGVKLVKNETGSALSSMRIGQNGWIFVVNNQGKIVVHPDRSLVGMDVSGQDWFEEMKRKPGGRLAFTLLNKGYLASYDYSPNWKWYVLATAPDNEVYGTVRRTAAYVLLLGGVGALIMAGVLMWLTRRFLSPLGLLENGVKQVGRGRLETRIPVTTNDELASLARGFNQMTTRIQETLAELQSKEMLFRSLTENASDLVIILDRNAVFVYASPSVESRLGYGAEEMIGCHFPAFIVETDRPQFERFLKQAVEYPGLKCEVELHLCHKSGEISTFDIIGRDLLDDPVVKGIVLNARDVTERKTAEEAVRESEERYRNLFDNISDFIYTHDLEGRFLSINRLPAAGLGYRPEELVGRSMGETMSLQDRRAFYEIYLPGIKKEGQYQGLSVFLSRDGKKHYLEARNHLVHEEGKAPYVRGSARDITPRIMMEKERKLAETALKESEERYRTVLDASPDPIAVYDPYGNMVYVNAAFPKVFGWQPEELFARNIPFEPREGKTIARFMIDMVKQGQIIYGLETRRTCRNGTVLDVSISAAPFYGRQGEYTGSVVIHRDITGQKKAGEALRESEKRYRTILESSPDPIVLSDVQGIIIYANSAYIRVFGWTPDELKGRKIDFFTPECSAQALEKIEGLRSARRFFGYEARMYNKRGDILNVSLSADVWLNREGTPAGNVVNLRDITLQKKMELQLRHAQKMEAVGTLAGGVAHDFNNILQAITGYVQLLLMKEKSDRTVTEYLRHIDQSIQRAAVLINHLLTVSRKMESNLQTVDLGTEILDICELLKRTVPKMVEIKTELIESRCLVKADPIQLEQILLNLGNNAVDAMPEGGCLTFATKRTELDQTFCQTFPDIEPGPYALLRVSDTGCGMDSEIIEHIFEPFFTTKGPGKGSGLGLATVYGIVKSHRGTITCYSEPGRGATFNIYLPALDDTACIPQKELLELEHSQYGTETILLVDDEASILDVGEEILNQYGYTTLRATSGEEALEIYSRKKDLVDLVILDLGMPGMGGLRCLSAILEMNPLAKIVVASGYTSKEQVREVLKTGAKNFINKPYRLRDVLNNIREVLDGDNQDA